MSMRKLLCVTDPPVTGGAILPNGGTYTVGNDGYPVAYLGDKASCQACGSIGVIVMAGGTRRMNFGDGKQIALEGDLLGCKCTVKPIIISDKANAQNYDDMGDVAINIDGRDCVGECMHLLGRRDPFPYFNCYNRCAMKVVQIESGKTNG